MGLDGVGSHPRDGSRYRTISRQGQTARSKSCQFGRHGCRWQKRMAHINPRMLNPTSSFFPAVGMVNATPTTASEKGPRICRNLAGRKTPQRCASWSKRDYLDSPTLSTITPPRVGDGESARSKEDGDRNEVGFRVGIPQGLHQRRQREVDRVSDRASGGDQRGVRETHVRRTYPSTL